MRNGSLHIAIGDAIRSANSTAEYAALGMVDFDEDNPNPYDELIETFEDALKKVKFLKNHKHEWSEDKYCVHCGADGHA